MADFQGKIVMITGGTGDLGGPVARAFDVQGAKVVLVDRNAEKQRELFPDWVDSTDHWLAAPVDVTDPAAVAEVVEETLARFGQLDVLVNTVGGYQAGDPVAELDLDTWETMLTLNARSTLVMCRAAVKPMLTQGQGKIISTAARAGLTGNANHSAYAASKAAVIRLTESLSAEVKESGVNVNCILPSVINTPSNRSAMPNADHDKWVEPSSLADVILFLASDGARDIHGVALPVYGLS